MKPKFKIKKQSLFILLWTASILIAVLLGAIMGYGKAVIDHPIPNMDCGTLIMRQQIKGWDGYIDVPYDLNQFKNKYEESMTWNLTVNDTLLKESESEKYIYIWSPDENIYYTYHVNGTYNGKVNFSEAKEGYYFNKTWE